LEDFIQPIHNRSIPRHDMDMVPFAGKAHISSLIACFIRLPRTCRQRRIDQAVQNPHAIDTRAGVLSRLSSVIAARDSFIWTW
jgi:hypothetical protein